MGWSLRDVPAPTPDPLDVVCADGETLDGIDVSKWQGDVDWNAVASDDITFAFVRVSDGLNVIDEWFESNWEESRENGVYTGVYQFFRPAQDPTAQAELLLDKMGALPADGLRPVIDVEDAGGLSPAEVTAAIHEWIDVVEAETGLKPIIYSGKYFWQDNVQSADFVDYPLWVAQYGPVCPDIPNQWSGWVFHQTSASGSVAGVAGDCDTNVFNGDVTKLGEYLGGGECGDAVCNGDETPDTCPEDCMPCGVIGADGGIIDEDDDCFERFGTESYWREESTGWEDTLIWTNATEFDDPNNYGVWNLYFEQGGEYELEVYVDASFGEAQEVVYAVEHGGLTNDVQLDQSGASGWVSLGSFDFDAGGEQSIRADDNTGELNTDELAIVFDAVRLTPLGGSDTGDASTGDSAGDDGEDDGGTGGESGEDSDGAADEGGDAGGCGCTADRGGLPMWWLMVLAVGRRRFRARD
jgi:lysozyme